MFAMMTQSAKAETIHVSMIPGYDKRETVRVATKSLIEVLNQVLAAPPEKQEEYIEDALECGQITVLQGLKMLYRIGAIDSYPKE